MIYPTLTPENVTRDFIDVFGGYNHNARINDNEFYDMENMSSSNYPLLSTRRKRGTTKAALLGGTVGILYASDLFFVRQAENTVYVYKRSDEDTEDDEPIAEYTTTIASSTPRSLIMMGAYLIIMPDKYYVNTVNTTDQGNIEADITANSAAIQLCTPEGDAYFFDVVSDKEPNDPTDGMIWLDISTEPETPKKYYAANSMWQNVPTNYFKLIINDTTIASQFKEGDGVKITGIEEIPAASYPIVQKVIERVESTEIVLKGECNLKANLASYEVAEVQSGTFGSVKVWCVEDVRANELTGQNFTYGQQRKSCTDNTAAIGTMEWVDNPNVDLTNQRHTIFASNSTAAGTYFIKPELWENETLTNIVAGNTPDICMVKRNGKLGKKLTVRSTSASTYLIEELISYDIGTEFCPVIEASTGKYTTTLSFETAFVGGIKKGDKLYLSEAYKKTISTAIEITRKIPDMDYVIESKNRLWGCRYGLQGGKFVNEIYCSKLGDFKNWSCYEGISTDSYAASCGSDGKWTGAISFNGYPLFFKENHIHTVRGDYPPYSISDNIARGVKDGSSQSLAIINEALYYHSTDGVCAYQGGLPTKISSAFGDKTYKNASAVGYKNKYYCLMQDESTKEQVIMVYDVSRGLWHKESGVESVIPITAIKDDIIYAIVNASELFEPRSLIGAKKEVEQDFEWFVETGLYGLSMIDSKYISRINIRLSIDVGAELIVSIEYDSSGEWERLCTIHRTDTRTFTLPIKPRRCDHFRLRLEGNGHTKIYSISKTIEQGSDKVYG